MLCGIYFHYFSLSCGNSTRKLKSKMIDRFNKCPCSYELPSIHHIFKPTKLLMLRPPPPKKKKTCLFQSKKTAAFCPPAALRLLPPNSPAHGHVSAVLQGKLWAIEERILQLHSLIAAEWILRNLSPSWNIISPSLTWNPQKWWSCCWVDEFPQVKGMILRYFHVPLTNLGKLPLLGTHYPPGN